MKRMHLARLHPRLASLLAGATLCASLLACGNASQSSASSSLDRAEVSATSAASADDTDACSLLDPKEVETALGAPLAVPPFLVNGDGKPEPDGSVCQYEDASLHAISVDVDLQDGATIFKTLGTLQGMVDEKAKGLVHLADGTDLAGEWDEARVMGCCRFSALRGDQLVVVDVSGSRAALAEAARLADLAFKRVEKPLSIAGYRNVRDAIAFEAAQRPKRRDSCALATRAQAEAIIGPLASDPKLIDDDCEYIAATSGALGQPRYVLKVRWTGGFAELRQFVGVAAGLGQGMSRNMNLSGDLKDAFESTIKGGDIANPAWETAHYDVTGLQAVRKDVLVTIQTEGDDADHAVQLMVTAMSKL